MMAEQRLKHVVIEVDSTLYFYDGELPVKEGVVTIPDGADVWAGAAWIGGYQIDAETGEHLLWTDVTERARATATEVAKSDEKEDDADEGADVGGQPVQEDGVRTSEQPRDEGDAGSGADGGDGDGPADGDAAGTGALGLEALDALV